MVDVVECEVCEDVGMDNKYVIYYQGDYVKELIVLIDYFDFDVDGVCEVFLEWKYYKVENIMGFCDNFYCLVIIGMMVFKYYILWKDVLDDSMEVYLQN